MSDTVERYVYDTRLTPQENRRLAIALHSQGGPMVPVVVGDVARGNAYTSHWLFADGARLDGGPMAQVHEPVGRPREGWFHLQWEDYQLTLRNKVLYWRIRVRQVEETFERQQRELMSNKRMSRKEMEECFRRLEGLVVEASQCKLRLRVVEDDLNKHQPNAPQVKRELTYEENRRQQEEEAARATLLARAAALVV
jgi:hypothetical protein